MSNNTSSIIPKTPTSLSTTGHDSRVSRRDVLDGWMEKLDQIKLDNPSTVRSFLISVAHGQVPDQEATAVFNGLIAKEAYEVFADAFTVYNDSLKSFHDKEGKPFKTCLRLQLPEDWTPKAPQAMETAFESISVQRLEVLRPLKRLAANDDVAWHGVGAMPEPPCIPTAACNVVRVLLTMKTSVISELSVQGALEDDETVACALIGSTSIESLELGHPSQDDPVPRNEMISYERILSNSLICQKLKNLSIGQLRKQDDRLEKSSQDDKLGMHMRSLTSLTIHAVRGRYGEYVEPFLGQLQKSLHLAEVKLAVFEDKSEFVEKLAARLADQPSLTRLKISHQCLFRDNAHFLPKLFTKLNTGTTHLDLHQENPATEDAGRTMGIRFGSIKKTEDLVKPPPESERFLKAESCKLVELSMRNVAMRPGEQRSLFASIEHNTTLQKLDLSDSCIDIEALGILSQSLKKNTSITVTLPTSPTRYYMLGRGEDAVFYSFEQGDQASLIRDDFQLKSAAKSCDADRLEEMKLLFNREWKAQVDMRSTDLRQKAHLEVVSNVARLMATQIVQNDVHKRSGTSNSFNVEADNPLGSVAQQLTDVATLVTAHLESTGSLRRAVRLTELSTALDHRELRGNDPAQSNPAVQTLVTSHNQQALQRKLPDAPLAINAVDADGANRHLKEMVRKGNQRGLFEALKAGAMDFGRKVQRPAPKGPILNAFLPLNEMNEFGQNAALMKSVAANNIDEVRRWLTLGAVDIDGHALRASPPDSPLRTLLRANQVDENGANKQIVIAVRRNQPQRIAKLFDQGAIDFGQVGATMAEGTTPALRAVFFKPLNRRRMVPSGRSKAIARPPKTQTTTAQVTTTTNTTTTTTTTGTVSTTSTTPSQVHQTAVPPKAPGSNMGSRTS